MDVIIHYLPAHPRELVVLHAWDGDRSVWDIPASPAADGSFAFRLQGAQADPRTISFKYRFPREQPIWEPDDYVRQYPTHDAAEIWTFDYTRRCLIAAPGVATDASDVVFHVVTQSRYVGGGLFAWLPDSPGKEQETFALPSRSDSAPTYPVTVPIRDWMRGGFHFKLVQANGSYEPESANRVWRPSDGESVWLKAGAVELLAQPLVPADAQISVIYPVAAEQAPTLHIEDSGDDFAADLASSGAGVAPDPAFRLARYTARVYPGALYNVHLAAPNLENPPLVRPFRIRPGSIAEDCRDSVLIPGAPVWLSTPPARAAAVRIRVSPNPRSAFGDAISLEIRTGGAPEQTVSPLSLPFETVTARRQPDGVWEGETQVFADVPHWFALSSASGVAEARGDGPVQSQRTFTAPADSMTVLSTIDGVPGLLARPANAPPVTLAAFTDVNTVTRQSLLAAAFSPEIAGAGVFSPGEMPHGVTFLNGMATFVLYAPYAVQAEVRLLDPIHPDTGPETEHPMALTPDLRYWWVALPEEAAPHGARYRFRLNGTQEALDPASRWAQDNGELWAQPGEGFAGSWSRVVDVARLRASFAGSAWRTPGWESLLLYELHPLRFTRRNLTADQPPAPVAAFDQVRSELAPGRYLHNLSVSGLELLPTHEFPSRLSWGYNPSLFFAIESLYGGPEGLAACVRAAHDAGKAVVMDVVFNHMVDSPLQAIARGVYADGRTVWGDMVNYDHPVAREFFRQALVYLWHAFDLDGFRFDATEAIINGQRGDTSSAPFILAKNPDGSYAVGSGGGWEFLGLLRQALRAAAGASGRSWPYTVAENNPLNMPITNLPPQSGVLDAEWHFGYSGSIGYSARNQGDNMQDVAANLAYPESEGRPPFVTVRYAESHDEVSGQNAGSQRIAQRPPFGQGWQMAKAVGAAVVLGRGTPMLFMGEEAGETLPFFFGMDDLGNADRYLDLSAYETLGTGPNRVLAWWRDLMGLRNDVTKGLFAPDESVARGRKTLAFVRGGGRICVICTFGAPDGRQSLGMLGLPNNGVYKEIFNSSWPAYQVESEPEATNGGYQARLNAGSIANLPSIGAVVLERV